MQWEKAPHIRFCETNPIYLSVVFSVTHNGQGSCDGKTWENDLGSFWKTNPIWGPIQREFGSFVWETKPPGSRDRDFAPTFIRSGGGRRSADEEHPGCLVPRKAALA
jgi:hypothetical protein